MKTAGRVFGVSTATAPNSTTAVAFNSRVTDNILRVGVNYKFDAIWAYD